MSLLAAVKGFEKCGASDQLCVLAQSGSLIEDSLAQIGQSKCLQLIPAEDQRQFVQRALQWVSQQPQDCPLLLENCASSKTLPVIALATPGLRLSRRPVYYMFRDLALSYNPVGNMGRKLAFACLSPRILCNSQFTARHISSRLGQVQEILHPPIDTAQFNDRPPSGSPPPELQPILESGMRLIVTPSRISSEDHINDKNLRSLPFVLAHLKAGGHNYHGVIIGQDTSPGQTRSHSLREQAKQLGVADRFTILPSTFAIENYYKYADVVVTLAPREPFGRTIVEAIACGVPVVGSQTGGIGEILNHFAPEWTVNPHDPAAAAATIVQIARTPNTAKLLAQGQRWVEMHCSITNYARRMMKITGLESTKLPETELVY